MSNDIQDLTAQLLQRLSVEGDNYRNDVAMTADEWDKLSAALVAITAASKIRRNKLAPIYKLPPELLARIFEHLQKSLMQTRTTASIELHPLRTLIVTSQYFRSTALAHPSLWSYIKGGTNVQYARASLERSAATPLTIDISSPATSGSDIVGLHNSSFIEELAGHSSRIRSLRLAHPFEERPLSLIQAFHFPAPALVSLDVQVPITIDGVPNLPEVFGGETPSLRRLTLLGFTDWPSNNFRDLTHVNLRMRPPVVSDNDSANQPRLLTLLNLLRNSPRLKRLILHRWCPTLEGDPESVEDLRSEPVVLEHLKSICFGWWRSSHSVRQVLRHLQIPRSADVYMWGDQIMGPTDNLSALRLPLRTIPADAHADNSIKELRLLCCPPGEQFVREQIYILTENGTKLHYQDPALTNNTTLPVAPTVLGAFSTTPITPAFGSVETLYLGGSFGTSLNLLQWRQFLEAFPSLRHLVVWKSPADIVLTMLALLSDSDDIGDDYSDEEEEEESTTTPITGQPTNTDSKKSPSSTGGAGAGTGNIGPRPPSLVCPNLTSLHIHDDRELSVFSLSKLAKNRSRSGHKLKRIRITYEPASPSTSDVEDAADGTGATAADAAAAAADEEAERVARVRFEKDLRRLGQGQRFVDCVEYEPQSEADSAEEKVPEKERTKLRMARHYVASMPPPGYPPPQQPSEWGGCQCAICLAARQTA